MASKKKVSGNIRCVTHVWTFPYSLFRFVGFPSTEMICLDWVHFKKKMVVLILFEITAEIERLLNGGSKDPSPGSKRFCDVTKDKPIKVTVRTSVPTRDHPKVGFSFFFFFYSTFLCVPRLVRRHRSFTGESREKKEKIEEKVWTIVQTLTDADWRHQTSLYFLSITLWSELWPATKVSYY